MGSQPLELKALVHSCTSNDIYMTAGEVPETIMTGDTGDISHIAEFAWFDWVMFRDNVPGYSDSKETLGRYLGPAIDTGSALMAKISSPMASLSTGQRCDTLMTRSSKVPSILTNTTNLTCQLVLTLDRWQRHRILMPNT